VRRGVFITFEGCEGSGKTTQLRILAERLESAGLATCRVREPGGSTIGEAIRAILLDPANKQLDMVAELLLYEASRAQHVAEVISPALEAGKIVLCDRYTDSSVAYQGYGRGIPLADVEALNRVATRGLTPDRTIVLDIAPDLGIERAAERAAEHALGRAVEHAVEHSTGAFADRIESEGLAFHARVRKGFLVISHAEPDRVRVIDASGSVEAVSAQVTRALSDIEALAAVLGGRH